MLTGRLLRQMRFPPMPESALARQCAHPDCIPGQQAHQCECCETWFCEDHGTLGGDREGYEGEPGAAAPSRCWKCGGFNADE
jgi:hypothetical protein